MRKLSKKEQQMVRAAATAAHSKHGCGGLDKKHSNPKEITLPKLRCLEKPVDDRV